MLEALLEQYEEEAQTLREELPPKQDRLAALEKTIHSIRTALHAEGQAQRAIRQLAAIPSTEELPLFENPSRRFPGDTVRAFCHESVQFYRRCFHERRGGVAGAADAARIADHHFCDRLSVYDMLLARTWKDDGPSVTLTAGAHADYEKRCEEVRREGLY